jgi:branched-chain amino acid transport system substrate-binding protein
MTRRRLAAPVAIAVAVGVLLSGCGTRASDAEVRAGAQSDGAVTLDQSSLDALRTAGQATAGAPGTASDPGTTTSTAPGAAGSGGTAAGPAAAGAPRATTPAAGRTTTAATTLGACTTPGAPVYLGQVGTFSGLAGPIAGDGLAAMAVWAKEVNASGGLACHPVTLYVRDDGGDPARAAAAVQDLTGRGVVAFVGNLTPLSQAGFLPEIKKKCTPAIGIDFGPEWATEPCLFPQGGGWNESIAGLVRQSVDRGDRQLGLLYCVEISSCGQIGKSISSTAAKAGAQLVYSSAISLTQTDYTAQCQNAKNAGVQELVVAMEGSAMARLARSCLALNFKPLLVGAAFAINGKQSEDPQVRELGLAAINADAPWFSTDQPGLRAYQAALARYAPQIATSGITLQMYAAGKLLEAGIATLGAAARTQPLTSALIVQGMDKVHNETLGGLTAPLDFTVKGRARSSGCVYLTVLGKSGWTAPNGTKPLCISAKDMS